MKRLILPLLFLSFAPTVGATTIVILRTTKGIVVAADSKHRDIGNLSTPVSCKINCSKNGCFAMSGVTLVVGETGVLLDGRKLAREVLRKGGGLKEALSTFEEEFLQAFPAAAAKIVRDYPDYYQNEVDKKVTLAVIFFGLEGGEPRIVGTQFRAQGYGEGRGVVTPESIGFRVPKDAGELHLNILGKKDAILRVSDARPGYFSQYDLATAARMMIELEIVDSPDLVGPPVDMVRVDRKGVRWVARKGGCE